MPAVIRDTTPGDVGDGDGDSPLAPSTSRIHIRPTPVPHPQRSPHIHHDHPRDSSSSFFHALYDTTTSHSPYTAGPSSMFSYFPQSSGWAHQPHHHHHVLPPAPPPAVPPPQIAHKVWILDCKSCGTFLTNRGMKAVLLLRPNVSLFSTDALPINCSAYSANPDVLRASPCRPTHPPRTCECLTQTLCCHGCGTGVGYMIVIPCARCTSSITATNRATNGHRFVFHSNEIVGSERHYIFDEPGVVPFDVPPPAFCPPPHPHPLPPYPLPGMFIPPPPPLRRSLQADDGDDDLDLDTPPPLVPAYLPTPPQDRSPISPTSPSAAMASFPFPPPPRGMPVDVKEIPPARRLRAGEVLYWHHLARNGEIPGVSEDPRARRAAKGLEGER